MLAGQSVVLVKALESLAAVCAAQGRPHQAAVLLGSAQTARNSASATCDRSSRAEEELRRSLKRILGTAAFDTAHAEGERTSPAAALRSASASAQFSDQGIQNNSASPAD